MKEQFYKWWSENGYKGRPYCVDNCDIEGITPYYIEKFLRDFKQDDVEMTDYNNVLAGKVQKFQDTNRIERKAFRENIRVSNALEEYNKELIKNLKLLKPVTTNHSSKMSKATGLIQISDTHFNELINIKGNKYDFEVASQRLKLLCDKAKIYFKAQGIKNVLVAFTGDLLNSDRRLDEMLNQATNRAKATLLAVHILRHFVEDLNQDFNVNLAGVSGNESRANEEMGYAEIVATDNYDFTIFNILKIAFENCEGISFTDGNWSEKIVEIANQKILLTHGLSIKGDVEKSVQQLMGKHSQQGDKIDYVFIGHIHSARVGDLYSRSSGLCGGNAYSDYGLNLASRASQNIGIFYENKSHDVIKVDLQITDDVKGYDIIEKLEAYNAKSADKVKHKTPVIQIFA